MGKVEENKLIKKKRLMETALELFTSKGIVRTSISDIVQQSGVAKGTFYLYFRDKYDLQEKLITHKAEQMFRHAVENSGYENENTVEDKVLVFLHDILGQMQKDKATLRFINKNLSWGAFRHAMENVDYDMRSFFKEMLQIFETEEVLIVSYMIIELVGSSCYSVILENDPVDLEHYLPYLDMSVRSMIRGYREMREQKG